MAGSVLGFRVRVWLLSAFAGGGRGRKIEEHFEVLEHDEYCCLGTDTVFFLSALT
jgi:hypothetical protein